MSNAFGRPNNLGLVSNFSSTLMASISSASMSFL
jgi:hypothetical protein